LGFVDAPKLLRGTPYAVLGIFIVAAILTPTPDWVSQLLLGIPMVLLYLLGVGVACVFTGARKTAPAPKPESSSLTPSGGCEPVDDRAGRPRRIHRGRDAHLRANRCGARQLVRAQHAALDGG